MFRWWRYWQESGAAENPRFWICCGMICWKAGLPQTTLSVCAIRRRTLTTVWPTRLCIRASRSKWPAMGATICCWTKYRKLPAGKKRSTACWKTPTPIFMWPAPIPSWCPAKSPPIWRDGISLSQSIPCPLLNIWISKNRIPVLPRSC